MVDLLAINPAWQVPPGYGGPGCCSCIDEPECPTVTLESRTGEGFFSRPTPCGFFHEDEFYLTKRRERFVAVRTVSSPPHFYACEEWVDGGGTTTRIRTEEHDVVTNYNALEITTYAENEDGACEGPTTETEVDSYTRLQYINHRHSRLGDPTCVGADIPGSVPPGGMVEEVDPDNSTDVTTYSDPWVPLDDDDIKDRTDAAMEESLAAAEWVEDALPYAASEVSWDIEGAVLSAYGRKVETRWYVGEDYLGYIRIEWQIQNWYYDVIEEGESEHLGASEGWDGYVMGPVLERPEWPTIEEQEQRYLVVVAVSCVPDEEE